jgi:hypothetical protein
VQELLLPPSPSTAQCNSLVALCLLPCDIMSHMCMSPYVHLRIPDVDCVLVMLQGGSGCECGCS